MGGAAKLKVKTTVFGNPPEPSKIQPYPGVSTNYLPHEGLIIYRETLAKEGKARATKTAYDQWVREHKKKKREQEEVEQMVRNFRLSRSLSSPSPLNSGK